MPKLKKFDSLGIEIFVMICVLGRLAEVSRSENAFERFLKLGRDCSLNLLIMCVLLDFLGPVWWSWWSTRDEAKRNGACRRPPSPREGHALVRFGLFGVQLPRRRVL